MTGIHSLGTCENNKKLINDGGWWGNVEVYKQYKFALVMENTYEKGYVTEKLAAVLAAGTIPIYFGDDVAADFIFGDAPYISVSALLTRSEINLVSSSSEDIDSVTHSVVELMFCEEAFHRHITEK